MSDNADSTPNLPDDVVVLKALVGEKTAQLQETSALVREMELRIAVLEEKLRLAAHKRFGASSEKADSDQLQLFNEAEAIAAPDPSVAPVEDAASEITVPEHTRKTPGRKPIPDHLPRVRVEHDIPDAEKLCPCGSGCERPCIGEVVTEQYDVIPAKPQVLQHVRRKYGPCRQCDGVFPEPTPEPETPAASDAAPATSEPIGTLTVAEPRAIIVAPLPPRPIPKSNASPRLLAFITAMKFVDGLPLYRIETIFARTGLPP